MTKLAVVARSRGGRSHFAGMPHRVLGVAKNASPAVIKAAYRKLALVYHPDVKSTGCALKFQAIQTAQEKLLGFDTPEDASSSSQHSSPYWQQRESQQRWQRDESQQQARTEEEQKHEYEQWRRERAENKRQDARREENMHVNKHMLLRFGLLWVGLGGLIKIGAMYMAHIAREQALAAAEERGDPQSESLLAPIATENLRRRAPVPVYQVKG